MTQYLTRVWLNSKASLVTQAQLEVSVSRLDIRVILLCLRHQILENGRLNAPWREGGSRKHLIVSFAKISTLLYGVPGRR